MESGKVYWFNSVDDFSYADIVSKTIICLTGQCHLEFRYDLKEVRSIILFEDNHNLERDPGYKLLLE